MAEREQIRKPAPNERENETAESPSASERGERSTSGRRLRTALRAFSSWLT